MKFACTFLVIGTLAANANATSTTFYGTSGVDSITVGRAYVSGSFIYRA